MLLASRIANGKKKTEESKETRTVNLDHLRQLEQKKKDTRISEFIKEKAKSHEESHEEVKIRKTSGYIRIRKLIQTCIIILL